jgi:hypothetical protein
MERYVYVSIIWSHFFKSQQKLVLIQGTGVRYLNGQNPKPLQKNLLVASMRDRASSESMTKAQQGGPLQP